MGKEIKKNDQSLPIEPFPRQKVIPNIIFAILKYFDVKYVSWLYYLNYLEEHCLKMLNKIFVE